MAEDTQDEPYPGGKKPTIGGRPPDTKHGARAGGTRDPQSQFYEDPSKPSEVGPEYDTFGGQKYKFSEVPVDPQHSVEYYSAEDPNADITGKLLQGPVAGGNPKNEFARQLDMLTGGSDPSKITPQEYDQLTKEASKGNKLAQQILVKGHFKAQDFPSLTQDLNKMADPFVQALSNLPNVANTAEAQTQAVTQPYDFSNAETQVNNILSNQGYAQNAQPSAATQAYVGKLDSLAAGNPLTSSALGLPSIDQALGGLGQGAKLSEKAAPNSALLAALLSHLQYQDVYGTGLSTAATNQNPAWLQQLLAAVTGTAIGGGLVNPAIAAAGVGTTPSTGASTVPNTG